jgi:hypothetical protein
VSLAAARALVARRPGRAAVAGLALLVAFVLADVLRGRVLFERDIAALQWGLAASFARSVAAGSPPLWNPWMGFGQPMLANPAAQVAYPPTWAGLLLAPERWYSVYAAGHLLLASVGLFSLARLLRLSTAGAALAAAAWTASGPLLSYVSLWHHFAGVAWLPWVLVAAERCALRPSVRRALAWAAVAAVQVLAGSLDAVVMTAGLEVLLLARHVRWRGPGHLVRRRLLGATALAAGLTVGLTAIQWVPTVGLVAGSVRPQLEEGTRGFWSLRPLGLTQWLVPLFPQDLPLTAEVRQYLYQGREPFLGSHYLGLAAFTVALAAFRGPRRRAALALALVVLASAALVLGRHGLVYPWLVAAAPPLRLFRYPPKAAIIGAFAFALLVGLGYDAWRRRSRPDAGWRAWVAVPSLVAAALAVAVLVAAREGAPAWLKAPPGPARDWAVSAPVLGAALLAAGAALLAASRLRPPMAASLAGALALADLLQAHAGLNPTAPSALLSSPPEVLGVLARDGASRTYTFDYRVRAAGAPPWRLVEPAETDALPWAWRAVLLGRQYPPSLQRWGLPGSYEADPFSMDTPQRRSLWLLLVHSEPRPADHLRLLRVGGVSHVLARHREGLEALTPVATLSSPQAGDVRVLRVPGTLPRVLVTSGVRVAAGAAAYRVLLDPGFDPGREIVLPEGTPRAPGADFHGQARVLSFRPDRLRVAVRLDGPGHLLVVEGYDPGWRALVDGVPQPLLRANAAFRAVALPAGDHVVDLVYRPASLWLGGAASLATAAAFALAACRWRPRPDDAPSGASA